MFSTVLIFLLALVFGLSIVLIVLIFLSPRKIQTCTDPTIVIVKLVDIHRENLPLNSVHGWNLTQSSSCSLRCWQKDLPLKILGSPVTVYACAKDISCAAVILLNVIADVSTWSDWDAEVQDQTLHLELPEDPSLHFDPYMQCDQVLITSKGKATTDVEMYRFGNLESNGTGWILIWNAKVLDWILFVVQPFEHGDGDDPQELDEKCRLTAVWGGELKPDTNRTVPPALCSRILALSDAITESQSKLRPFQPLLRSSSSNNRHFPTIHSALQDLPVRPCVLLEHDRREKTYLQNGVLALVPSSGHRPLAVRNIEKFSLVLVDLKKYTDGARGDGAHEEKRRSRRKLKVRCDSLTSAVPKSKLKFDADSRRSSSLTSFPRRKPPELTVTQAEDQAEAKPPQRALSHSLLHALFPTRRSSDTSDNRSRSQSPSARSTSPGLRRRKLFKFEITSSLSSQEDNVGHGFDVDASDVSDIDMSFMKQSDNTDFRALGEYSVSAVVQENLKASFIDINSPEDEQKKISGGWVHKEVNKNIDILKKMTTLDSCVFMSYLCRGKIPVSASSVWETLCNPLTRFMYDNTVKKNNSSA